MRENRIVALCYRIAAFALCLLGLLYTLGVFTGEFNPKILLYYTTESNIFVLLMLGYLCVKTAGDLKRDGRRGSASYRERLTAVVTLSITVTFVIFWGLLAPYMGGGSAFLKSYTNLQIHGFTPILMIIDYFLFATPGRMKRQDPWLFAIVPFAYFIQSTILGFSGVRYGGSGDMASTRFPYFFVDFDLVGAGVFGYVAAITVFFVGLAYLLLWYDGRRARGRVLRAERRDAGERRSS